MTHSPQDWQAQLALLERRLKREKAGRINAEQLLSEKSSGLYRALKQSQQEQKNLELALWASQESFWQWQADTDMMDIRAFSLHADSVSTWSGTLIDLMSRVHEDDLESLQFHWSMALHGNRDKIEFSFRLNVQQGYQWVRLRGRVLDRESAGEALRIVGTTKDITQQRKAEQSFHLMASAFASSREPMLVLSSALLITECNEAFIRLIEAPVKDACLGLNFNELLSAKRVEQKNLAAHKQLRFESQVTTLAKQEIPVDVSIALFETYMQTSSYLIATMRDISDRKQNEDRLKQLALYDDLTGLSNRNALRGYIEDIYEGQSSFILVFIDLDGFKAINDTAGHEKGDNELQRVASLLIHSFGQTGKVGRWGGDEFIAVLPDTDIAQAIQIANSLIQKIEAKVIPVHQTELILSASIGVAHSLEHGDSVESLIQCADAAMYQAKKLGKGQVFIYKEGLYESMTQQVSMVNDLRRATENHLLDYYVQGKYDLNGKLKGGEVLCRWISGLHGIISPAVFIPLAEEHNLDHLIGLQALEAACDYISMMESQQGTAVPLSINISVNQMLDPDFPPQAKAICKASDVYPSMIELELTESIFIRDERAAVQSLNSLRDAGFRLSLDDFGSGFSSLSYLRSFQFEVVKVDRSLVKDIHQNSKAHALFTGLVAMLSSLEIEIVVEGVEQESYLPFMKEADIGLMQGFYFDKPMPYDQFLAKHNVEFA